MGYIKLFPILIVWWYTRGLFDIFNFINALFVYTVNTFSVKAVLKTFFAPWKKMVKERGKGIDGLRDWLLDNLVSRGVAIFMRIFILCFFLISIVIVSLLSIIFVIAWLIMPLIILFSIAYIFAGDSLWR